MSAIGAIVAPGRPGPVVRERVVGLLRGVRARSFEGVGLWEGPGVSMVQGACVADPGRRTSRAPTRSADETVCIVADVRLDNRDQLLNRLSLHPRTRLTDAEIIVAAYGRWGDEVATHLLGDFAFALWDARRAVLLCARDHMGVRPLLYHRARDGTVTLASDLSSLLESGNPSRELDEVALSNFLTGYFEDRSRTLWRDVHHLPPAHTLRLDWSGRMTLTRYWALDPGLEVRLPRDEDYALAFRDCFVEALRCRLPEEGPVGSMLSGGLDSSSVVCALDVLARDGATGPIHTFSQIYDESPLCDERAYMHAVLDGRNLHPHWIQGDAVSPLDHLDMAVQELAMPPFAENLVLTRASLRAAAGSVRVVLDGLHGDNTVSYGELHLADLLRSGRLLRVGRLLRAHHRHSPERTWRTVRHFALRPVAPEAARRVWRTVRRRRQVPPPPPLIDAEFAALTGVYERLASWHDELWGVPPSAQRVHHLELTAGITTATLATAAPVAAAAGVELRFPFLDRRLVELCYGIPPEQKFLDGWPRSLVRRGMTELLPPRVRDRKDKRGSGQWYTRHLAGPGRERLAALMDDAVARTTGMVDPVRLRDAHRQFLADPTYPNGRLLWTPLALAAWMRQAQPRPARRAGPPPTHPVVDPTNPGGDRPTHAGRFTGVAWA